MVRIYDYKLSFSYNILQLVQNGLRDEFMGSLDEWIKELRKRGWDIEDLVTDLKDIWTKKLKREDLILYLKNTGAISSVKDKSLDQNLTELNGKFTCRIPFEQQQESLLYIVLSGQPKKEAEYQLKISSHTVLNNLCSNGIYTGLGRLYFFSEKLQLSQRDYNLKIEWTNIQIVCGVMGYHPEIRREYLLKLKKTKS